MTEIASESVPNKPAKRAYHRKPVPPPPPAPPSPPSPAVIALENEIVKLVGDRLNANSEIAAAMQAANEANSRLQVAQTRLQQIEREVQYRIQLTQQMKGIAPQPVQEPWTQDLANGFGVSIPAGVSSIPAMSAQPRIVHTAPRIRSESAEGFRAEAI